MPAFRRRTPRVLAAAALALACAPAFSQSTFVDTHSQTFSKVVVIGDSLSDAGFFRPVLPISAQPVIGQFTTNPGRVWAQNLANHYGGNPDAAWTASPTGPTAGTGDNYAVGGARVVAPVTGALGPTPSLAQQTDAYLARTGGHADARALYTVWGGPNDLFTLTSATTPVTPAMVQSTIGAAVAGEVAIVAKLQGAGARYVLVPNTPDLGITPASIARGAQAQAAATQLATSYNDALYASLTAQGLRVIPLNTFGFLREVVASPALFGLTNVTGTACQPQITAQSLTCNPGSYVTPDAAATYAFADGVHPTTAAHQMLSDYAVATLEAPRQVAVIPVSAAWSGRARADMLASVLASPRQADGGMRWWFDGRLDQMRFRRGETGGGFGANAPAISGGVGWDMGAWRVGAAGGIEQMKLKFREGRGDLRQRDYRLAAFASYLSDGPWATVQLGYARLDDTLRRDLPLGVAVRRHTADANGSNLWLGVNGGWMLGSGRLSHGPVASVLLQRIRIDGMTESQPELSTALAYPSQSFNSRIASLGYEARFAITPNWVPFARISYDREFGKHPGEVWASMPSIPAAMPFAVPAGNWDRSHAMLAWGSRGRLFGIDYMTGSALTLGQRGGSSSTFFLTAGKPF